MQVYSPKNMHVQQDEVARYVQAKGWRDEPVTFGEAMMMLVTEIDEAQRAFMNMQMGDGGGGADALAAEFADIYIRLLDDCDQWNVRLASILDCFLVTEGFQDGQTGYTFLVNAVVDAVEAYRVHGFERLRPDQTTGLECRVGFEIQEAWARLYFRLIAMADSHGINLNQAFDIKMAVNWEREHRHGGKLL
jgi:hypothetical protein